MLMMVCHILFQFIKDSVPTCYVKEKLLYVALDYEHELQKAETPSQLQSSYESLDGQVIIIGSERFRDPEVSSKPNFIGLEPDYVHKLTFSSIMNCDRC